MLGGSYQVRERNAVLRGSVLARTLRGSNENTNYARVRLSQRHGRNGSCYELAESGDYGDYCDLGDQLAEKGYVVLEMCHAGINVRHFYLTSHGKLAIHCYEFAKKVCEGALT